MFKKDGICYIFGAGEYGELNIEKELLNVGAVIAADGGFSFLHANHIKPDLLVGDFDSFDEDIVKIERLRDILIVRHPARKDDTDLLLAVKEGMKRGFLKFRIYGALGGRLDHTIANIQILNYIAQNGGEGFLISDREIVTVVSNKSFIIPAEYQEAKYLSVFCLGEKAGGVTLRNLKYELFEAELTNTFPIGASNEFIGKEAEIAVKEGTLIVVMERNER